MSETNEKPEINSRELQDEFLKMTARFCRDRELIARLAKQLVLYFHFVNRVRSELPFLSSQESWTREQTLEVLRNEMPGLYEVAPLLAEVFTLWTHEGEQ